MWVWFFFSFFKFVDLLCVFKFIKRDGEILVILFLEVIKFDFVEDLDKLIFNGIYFRWCFF